MAEPKFFLAAIAASRSTQEAARKARGSWRFTIETKSRYTNVLTKSVRMWPSNSPNLYEYCFILFLFAAKSTRGVPNIRSRHPCVLRFFTFVLVDPTSSQSVTKKSATISTTSTASRNRNASQTTHVQAKYRKMVMFVVVLPCSTYYLC